jgi:hypothetical protein
MKFYQVAARNTRDAATSRRPELLHAVAVVQQHPAGNRKQAE